MNEESRFKTGQGKMFISAGWYDKQTLATFHDYLTAHPWGVVTHKDKPVAWMLVDSVGDADDICYEEPAQAELPDGWSYKPLYTHPVRREWVGLTDVERDRIVAQTPIYSGHAYDVARAIEAKLKEKNDA